TYLLRYAHWLFLTAYCSYTPIQGIPPVSFVCPVYAITPYNNTSQIKQNTTNPVLRPRRRRFAQSPLIATILHIAGKLRPLIKIQCPGSIHSNILLFRINKTLLDKGNILETSMPLNGICVRT